MLFCNVRKLLLYKRNVIQTAGIMAGAGVFPLSIRIYGPTLGYQTISGN